uniref:Uncharacterized protein n=1 Tax=Sphaerodactylus townsendi TaxID=933632 RepID=A0ACB8G1C9_9SAUR
MKSEWENKITLWRSVVFKQTCRVFVLVLKHPLSKYITENVLCGILNTTLFELPAVIGTFPSWSIFIILLLVLQVLHYFWTYLIVKAAYKAFSKGKAGKWNPLHARDDRSDVESSSDEEPSPHSKTSHSSATTNGTSGANGTNGYLTGGSSAEEH